MNHLEKDIRLYVEKCFTDAAANEGRYFNPLDLQFEYVIVSSNDETPVLVPLVFKYKFERVRRTAIKRIKRNIAKHFGMVFASLDGIKFITSSRGAIDPNYTEFVFSVIIGGKPETISLSIIDEYFPNTRYGEVMPAYRYEKLLFSYWKIDADVYRHLPKDHIWRWLPDILSRDWMLYRKLYRETFGEEVGARFNIELSSGVVRYEDTPEAKEVSINDTLQ